MTNNLVKMATCILIETCTAIRALSLSPECCEYIWIASVKGTLVKHEKQQGIKQRFHVPGGSIFSAYKPRNCFPLLRFSDVATGIAAVRVSIMIQYKSPSLPDYWSRPNYISRILTARGRCTLFCRPSPTYPPHLLVAVRGSGDQTSSLASLDCAIAS